jgi:uncharacterized protein (DUF58 family)
MKGEKRSPKRGSSIEFADFREYVPGDDLRYVDWKAYGRLEKLFVKLFVEEEDLSLHLLIDSSRSMDFGEPATKWDYARRVAAALGYIALADYDRVSVASCSIRAGRTMPPTRGKPGVRSFLAFLEQMAIVPGEANLGDGLAGYAARVRGGGIAVVLSDFFDETYAHGIRALLARRLQVVLIQILDTEEKSPTLVGDLRLVDAESGAVRDVSISPHVVAQYNARFAAFTDELKTLSARYGMDYVPITTDIPFEEVIIKYLRARGIVR